MNSKIADKEGGRLGTFMMHYMEGGKLWEELYIREKNWMFECKILVFGMSSRAAC